MELVLEERYEMGWLQRALGDEYTKIWVLPNGHIAIQWPNEIEN